MRFEDLSFRDLCHKICFISRSDNFDYMTESLRGSEEANGTLVYCYVDHEAGMTFEILACASFEEGKKLKVFEGNNNISLKYRLDAVENCSVEFLDEKEYHNIFSDKIEMILNDYEVNNKILSTRDVEELDNNRSREYPDDILVIMRSDGISSEGCWVRCEGIMGDDFYGFLLNEPYGDFPVHKGDIIRFKIEKQKNGNVECVAYY